MKNNTNKIYLSLLMTFVLFYTAKLYSLESKNLSSKVQFTTETANQINSEDEDKTSAELVNDGVYNNQPIIRVKGAPLQESSAEKMRKRRNEAEVDTENKIAETIEKARLENEKKLSNSLFGGKLQAPTPPPAAVQVQPNNRLGNIEKSLSEIKSNLFNQEFDKLQQDSDRYVSLDIGSGKYTEASMEYYELTTQSVFGIGTGMRVEDNPFITLEGHFLYSKHLYTGNREDVNQASSKYPVVTQYNAGLALKYDIIPFVITPRLGGTIDYTFRQYNENKKYNSSSAFKKTDTHSIEAGLIVGGYIQVSKYLGLEITYRHMKEISSNSRKTKGRERTNTEYTLLGKEGYGLFLLSIQMGFR